MYLGQYSIHGSFGIYVFNYICCGFHTWLQDMNQDAYLPPELNKHGIKSGSTCRYERSSVYIHTVDG